jgi:hypothetical protein
VHAERAQGQATEPTKSARLDQLPSRLGSGAGLVGGAVRYQHVMADRDAAIARELNRLIEGT